MRKYKIQDFIPLYTIVHTVIIQLISVIFMTVYTIPQQWFDPLQSCNSLVVVTFSIMLPTTIGMYYTNEVKINKHIRDLTQLFVARDKLSFRSDGVNNKYESSVVESILDCVYQNVRLVVNTEYTTNDYTYITDKHKITTKFIDGVVSDGKFMNNQIVIDKSTQTAIYDYLMKISDIHPGEVLNILKYMLIILLYITYVTFVPVNIEVGDDNFVYGWFIISSITCLCLMCLIRFTEIVGNPLILSRYI